VSLYLTCRSVRTSARDRSESYQTNDPIKTPYSAPCGFRTSASVRRSRASSSKLSANTSLLPPSDAKDPNGVYMESIRRIYDVTEAKRRKEEQYRNLVKRQMYTGIIRSDLIQPRIL